MFAGESIWDIFHLIVISRIPDQTDVQVLCYMDNTAGFQDMMDLIAMRLQRAAVAAQVMLPDTMLMGTLSIGSFQQSIVDTESWLTCLASWPKRLYAKESMAFTKLAIDIPMTTRQLPSFRAMLPSIKCFNNLFAICIDMLMGALTSIHCSGSYKLIIRPISSKATAGRAKETSRYEMLWVLKKFDLSDAEFFVQVTSIASTEVVNFSHGMFNVDTETYELKETFSVEKIALKSRDGEPLIEANYAPPILLTPPPSTPEKKMKKQKATEPPLPTISVTTEPSQLAQEILVPELPNKPALEVDVPISSSLSATPDPIFRVKSMLGNNRQKCARVRLPHEIIKLNQ